MSLLSNWSNSVYNGPGSATNVFNSGTWFQILYMLINYIMLVNLVIAIFASTYSYYLNLSNGVYYDELINIFVDRDWVDFYGCIVCC